MKDVSQWKNQVGIVTGAASGLGLAIAKKLSSEGVTLALVDVDARNLEMVRSQFPGECKAYILDMTKEAQVKKQINKIGEQWGRIDILVNSAGIIGKTGVMTHEVATDELLSVLEVNFMGYFFSSKYALPWMLKNNYGRILHIASIAGKEGNPGMLAYSASKAAVIGMTKVQGKEYAQTGITINALAPAVIRTAMIEGSSPHHIKVLTDKIPMNRCGTLDEAANCAAFIVSFQNSFTTGFTFDLSGGRATY